MSETAVDSEVLTDAEAAAFLRLPLTTLRELVARGEVPGRRAGKEWRFSRTALRDWLRGPSLKERLLRQAGGWKDDPFLDEILEKTYQARGRSIFESKP